MAARRLFSPHPCLASRIPSNAPAPASKQPPRSLPAAAVTAERLKRRTRSDAEFDPELYRRYAGTDSGGHVPVLLGEVLQCYSGVRLRSFIDCTLGAAGHSSAIIDAHEEMEVYIGLDIDPAAHEIGCERIQRLLSLNQDRTLRVYTHVRNYKYINRVIAGTDENLLISGVDGILVDLGVSSMQIDSSERGFSVLHNGPLDMRMDQQASLKAEDILNTWPELELGRVLREYGEESNWKLLQKQIIRARSAGGFHTTGDLVELIRRTFSNSAGRHGWIKTATRVFQALRIAVNDELKTLENAVYSCFDCLAPGGRLAVISFHSLEDRIVKKAFLDLIDDDGNAGVEASAVPQCRGHPVVGRNGIVLTKRPITPSKDEEGFNPRCRSAKLRILQKGMPMVR